MWLRGRVREVRFYTISSMLWWFLEAFGNTVPLFYFTTTHVADPMGVKGSPLEETRI